MALPAYNPEWNTLYFNESAERWEYPTEEIALAHTAHMEAWDVDDHARGQGRFCRVGKVWVESELCFVCSFCGEHEFWEDRRYADDGTPLHETCVFEYERSLKLQEEYLAELRRDYVVGKGYR